MYNYLAHSNFYLTSSEVINKVSYLNYTDSGLLHGTVLHLCCIGYVLIVDIPVYISATEHINYLAVDMVILLAFPDDMYRLLLGEWLDVPSIVNLDTACCRRQSRQIILNALGQVTINTSTYRASHVDSIILRNLCRWIILRSVKVNSITVPSSVSSEDFCALLEVTGGSLTYIGISQQSVFLLPFVARRCKLLEAMSCNNLPLKMTSMTDVDNLKFPALKSLVLQHRNNKSEYATQMILSSSCLERISIHSDAAIDIFEALAAQANTLHGLALITTTGGYSSVQLARLISNCKYLHILVLTVLSTYSSKDTFPLLSTPHPTLHALHIHWYAGTAAKIVHNCATNLKYLHIDTNSAGANLDGLVILTNSCKQLIDLTIVPLYVNTSTEAKLLSKALQQASQLQYLDIRFGICHNLVFSTIPRDLPNLMYLGIFGTTCTEGAAGFDALAASTSIRTLRVHSYSVQQGKENWREWHRLCPAVLIVSGNAPTPFWRLNEFDRETARQPDVVLYSPSNDCRSERNYEEISRK